MRTRVAPVPKNVIGANKRALPLAFEQHSRMFSPWVAPIVFNPHAPISHKLLSQGDLAKNERFWQWLLAAAAPNRSPPSHAADRPSPTLDIFQVACCNALWGRVSRLDVEVALPTLPVRLRRSK